MRLRANSRSAMTLLELLVVIAIIALLASIAVSAVFRLMGSQEETNSNKHLLKIQMGLDQQWKAAVDLISRETVPDLIYEMTLKPDGSRDAARAKALHMKLRLRQEFPQNYAELRFTFQPVPGVLSPAQATLLNQKYGPKPVYLNAIAAPPGVGTPVSESAALLVLALSQNRGGVTFNVQEAGPIDTIDVGGKPMRVLVDEWKTPICLRRWATNAEADAINELNQPPFVNAASMVTGNKDPQDPEGRLKPGPSPWGVPAARALALSWFVTPLPEVPDPFDGLNRGPYVVSAGRNKTFMDPDDLYSFRLQREGRGN